jgi:hypothetical protein
MYPVIAKVVVVREEIINVQELEHPPLGFVQRFAVFIVIVIGGNIFDFMNLETMQMKVLPAKGSLDDEVELGQGERTQHHQPAPHSRFDIAELDVKQVRATALKTWSLANHHFRIEVGVPSFHSSRG